MADCAVVSIDESIDQIQLIKLLVDFIDYHLDPSDQGLSESKTQESVAKGTEFAAEIIATVSAKAVERATSASKVMKECVLEVVNAYINIRGEILDVVQPYVGWGMREWVCLGLAAAAHTIEKCVEEGSVELNCWDLLSTVLELANNLKFFREEVQNQKKILDLPKDLKKFRKEMSHDKGEILKNAVMIIVEGAVMCCDYVENRREGNKSCPRFWSVRTVAAQLAKTRDSLNEVTCYLDIRRQNRKLAKQFTQGCCQPCKKPRTEMSIPALNITWEESCCFERL